MMRPRVGTEEAVAKRKGRWVGGSLTQLCGEQL